MSAVPSHLVIVNKATPLPATPANALRPTLRALQVAGLTRLMFLRWPICRRLTEQVGWWLTDLLPHPGGFPPLLTIAVVDALQYMRETQIEQPDDQKDSDEVLIAYLRGLFKVLPALAELNVRSDRGTWEPLRDGPFAVWAQRHRPIVVNVYGERSPGEIKHSPHHLRLALLQAMTTHEQWIHLGPHLPFIADVPAD
jgi:hypothetical protein